MKALARWDWLGEPLALDFANTVRRVGWEYRELLRSGDDVSAWTRLESDRLPVLAAGLAEGRLGEIRRVRDDVFALLLAATRADPPPPEPAERINARLRALPAVVQLPVGPGDEAVWLPADLEPVDVLLGRVAADAVTLIGDPDRGLALCNAPSCGQFFMRERSNQRWCGPACGTRARVARHATRADRKRRSA